MWRGKQYINQHQHTVKIYWNNRKKTIQIGNTEYSQISEGTLTQPNILHIEREQQQNGSHQYRHPQTHLQQRRDVNLINQYICNTLSLTHTHYRETKEFLNILTPLQTNLHLRSLHFNEKRKGRRKNKSYPKQTSLFV